MEREPGLLVGLGHLLDSRHATENDLDDGGRLASGNGRDNERVSRPCDRAGADFPPKSTNPAAVGGRGRGYFVGRRNKS